MRKRISLLCAVMIGIQSILMGAPAYADGLTTEAKANILNQVHLLTGDGTSYNLGGSLKRSEAAAFVVKALGMQNSVLQNKQQYSQTTFKDVPKGEWYAPYVGYMTQQNIISGYPDGTFKPNENVSEKAFFSMVLKAMGYTSTDFEWNTINKAAFEAGLVSDIMYVFKEDDNTNFKRSDVVNVLYSALGKPLKNQQKKFIQLLVDNKMITVDKAELFGFVKIDKLPTAIKDLKVTGTDKIAVTFNESIVVPPAEQIEIYLKSNINQKLKVKSMLWNVDTLTIEMDPQSDKQPYIVNFPSLTDTEGNVVENVKSDFTGYNTPDMVSPFFKLSKIEAVNSKTINVYFTHPLNEKADIELLYDIYVGDNKWIEGGYKTLGVKRSNEKKNLVTITLKEGIFATGTKYALQVKGDLKSAYGVNLNKGLGDTAVFTGVEGTLIPAQITSVYSEEGRYIYLEFSQMVDRESVLKLSNYTIKEKDTGRILPVLQVYGMKESAQVDKRFVLRTDGILMNKTYELSVKNLYDTYRTAQLPELKSDFINTSISAQELRLETAFPINKNVIVAVFNRELKDVSVNASAGMEGGPIIILKEIDPDNPKYLRLYLSSSTPLQAGKTYPLRFSGGIMDFMDKSQTKTLDATVAGTDTPRIDVGIESATFIDDGVVLVKFTQPINTNMAAAVNKYEIVYSDGKNERLVLPSSVEVVSDKVVLVKMPYLMALGTYTLKLSYIYEKSGQFSVPLLSAEIK